MISLSLRPMLPPRHALLGALLCCCVFGCAQNNSPVPLAEQLPADAVLDRPDVGLVEPRVVVLPAGPVDATALPALSASANYAFVPNPMLTVGSVREVVLQVAVEGAAEQGELTLELLQPSGAAYEVRATRIGGDVLSTYQAQFVVPVAGTAIDRANLAGAWSANFLFDGKPLASTTFELYPQ